MIVICKSVFEPLVFIEMSEEEMKELRDELQAHERNIPHLGTVTSTLLDRLMEID